MWNPYILGSDRDEHGRYKQLKSHLTNQDWQTIPDKGIKKMLLGCITGAARQEIELLLQTGEGIAFDTNRLLWSRHQLTNCPFYDNFSHSLY